MANFKLAMQEVIRWEGYYNLDPHDPGGETYSGISRHFWPGWTGWGKIDAAKDVEPIPHNAQVPAADEDVMAFYESMFWLKFNVPLYDLIASQVVASKMFQHHVNMGVRAVRLMEEIARSGSFDTLPICINMSNSNVLLVQYINKLKEYYNSLVANHPNLQRYYKGWIARAEALPMVPRQ